MKRFEKQYLNRRDHFWMDVAASVMRVLLTPIFIWYRLYLWVWDGSMFNDRE